MSEVAGHFDRRARSYVGEDRHRIYAERLVEVTPLQVGDRFLDVAVGTGFAALAAQRAGAKVIGVDISPEMVEESRRRGIAAVVADACALPFPDRSFDVVCCASALAYMDEVVALREFHRVLEPEGLLSFSTMRAGHPTRAATFRQCAERSGITLEDPNERLGSEARAIAVMEDARFEVERVVVGTVELPVRTPSEAWEGLFQNPLSSELRRQPEVVIDGVRRRFIETYDIKVTSADVLYVVGRAGPA